MLFFLSVPGVFDRNNICNVKGKEILHNKVVRQNVCQTKKSLDKMYYIAKSH